jgi:hypothetical protein
MIRWDKSAKFYECPMSFTIMALMLSVAENNLIRMKQKHSQKNLGKLYPIYVHVHCYLFLLHRMILNAVFKVSLLLHYSNHTCLPRIVQANGSFKCRDYNDVVI